MTNHGGHDRTGITKAIHEAVVKKGYAKLTREEASPIIDLLGFNVGSRLINLIHVTAGGGFDPSARETAEAVVRRLIDITTPDTEPDAPTALPDAVAAILKTDRS